MYQTIQTTHLLSQHTIQQSSPPRISYQRCVEKWNIFCFNKKNCILYKKNIQTPKNPLANGFSTSFFSFSSGFIWTKQRRRYTNIFISNDKLAQIATKLVDHRMKNDMQWWGAFHFSMMFLFFCFFFYKGNRRSEMCAFN